VTGWSGTDDYFTIEEFHGLSDTESVVRVIAGQQLGVIFRGAVGRERRHRILQRLRAGSLLRTRGSEAPGGYVGTVHYLRDTDDYLESVPAAERELEAVLGADNPLDEFWSRLNDVLARHGLHHRLARHGGLSAGSCIVRSLPPGNSLALSAHEDLSQCRDPRQRDFEIQGVCAHQVLAVNANIDAGEGGHLVIWNVKPDDATRARLGTWVSGAPYPVHDLSGYRRLDLAVRPGDLYVFNSGHVHAVEAVRGPESRTSVSALFGQIDARTVVSWA
jgi:hypothetical protein